MSASPGAIAVEAWVLRSDEHGMHWHRLMFTPAGTGLNEHWNPDAWVRVPSLDTVIVDPGVSLDECQCEAYECSYCNPRLGAG